VYSYFKKYQD
jgi:hypothetical protein